MKKRDSTVETRKPGRIADSELTGQVPLFANYLSESDRKTGHTINAFDFGSIEAVSTTPCFFDNPGKIESYRPDGIFTGTETNKLWMIPVSLRPVLKNFLSQKSFSPNRKKSLSVEVAGM